MIFIHPWFILAALAIAVWAVFSATSHSEDGWRKVIAKPVLLFLDAKRDLGRRFPLLLIIAALIALAMSSPALQKNDQNTLQHSNGWIVVADVSRSTTADDVAPNRLAAIRDTLIKLADKSQAKPIALIIYAGDAFIAVPPAFDKSLFKSHSALLEYGVVPIDGSNLARALSLAASVITDSGFLSARVLLLSDSGGMNSSSEAAARFLAAQGHRLDVLLFGSSNSTSDTQSNLSVNVNQAKSIADAGGGELIRANSLGAIALDKLDLNQAQHATQNANITALHWQNQSHWLLIFGVGPLLLWAFWRAWT